MRTIHIQLLIILFALFCGYQFYNRIWKFYHPWIDLDQLHELLKEPFSREDPVTIIGDIKVNQLDEVHIFLIVNSPPVFVQAMTLIKSLLYYQGRVAVQRSECSMKTGRFSGLEYLPRNASNRTLRHHTLVLHFMADAESRRRITQHFLDWRLADIIFLLYPLESYWEFFSRLPVRHYAGTSALYKLAVPYILPDFIDKVIVFDADILINEDIHELWKQFQKFKDDQIIGAVCEQIIDCPTSCPSNGGIPTFGINSGTMLMDLKGMRLKNWWRLWTEGAEGVMQKYGFMDNADQATINLVLLKHPELYHSLPCAWNVQVFKATGDDCCPVFWTDRAPGEGSVLVANNNGGDGDGGTETAASRSQMALAVHFNIRAKPVFTAPYVESELEKFRPEERLSVQHLRHRFYQVFTKFRNLPTDCII